MELSPEWERSGLDREGWHHLDRVANKLARHLYFEHLGQAEIRDVLHEAAFRYRTIRPRDRPPGRKFAAEVLGSIAQEPMRRALYLGVLMLLKLSHDTVMGDVRFVEPSREPQLAAAFGRFGDAAPQLLCEVEVTAGTGDLLRDRARDVVETALGLVRQQNLFGFNSKIYRDQVFYGAKRAGPPKWHLTRTARPPKPGGPGGSASGLCPVYLGFLQVNVRAGVEET